jgi:DNA recombination protein RmuC
VEDYQRLVAAREVGDLPLIESVAKELVNRIKGEAKDIRDKYIAPPETTDFGILYLPTEGLYAEITQRPGLQEQLQREYRVMVAGPNTIAALLNSLQMGFRTLAIEKRSSEVWQILGSVKSEFGKFGDLLDKTHKKLQEASNTIESAASKSRTIERKLDKVQDLPAAVAVEPVALVQSALEVEEEPVR